MQRLYSKLIGENPDYTSSFQPASKRKIALYANCLMIPVILWFINGYLLVSHVIEGGTIPAILTATIAALIIFLIERAIIMSNGSKPIFWFRILLGFIVASLGSISLDEVIFKNDIDNQVASYKEKNVDQALNGVTASFQNQIQLQQMLVAQKANTWNKSLNDVKSESDGTGGSHQRLVGPITKLKKEVAEKQHADYNQENTKLDALKKNFEQAKLQARIDASNEFKGNALLIRIRAMFELVLNNGYMLLVYVLFTVFLFCLEFLVVLIKASSKNSVDEELEKVRDELIRIKADKVLIAAKANRMTPLQISLLEKANKAIQNQSISTLN